MSGRRLSPNMSKNSRQRSWVSLRARSASRRRRYPVMGRRPSPWKGPVQFCTSLGTSTTTGPGRPVRAISKAVRMVASSCSGFVTRKTCLATGPITAVTGASWKASVPMAAVGTWPQITTMGTESAMQSRTGVTQLVAPGPEVTSTHPTLPLARA